MNIFANALLKIVVLILVPTLAAGQQLFPTESAEDAAEGEQYAVQPGAGQADINDFKRVHKKATVLIGVDVLGRIAIAADYDNDNLADEVMLFAGLTRLTAPQPTIIERATVTVTRNGVMVEAADRSLALAAYLSDEAYTPMRVPKKKWNRRFDQVVVVDEGIMFNRVEPPPEQQRILSTYDHNSIYSWPVNFHRDVLGPGTAGGSFPAGCFGCGSCQVVDGVANCFTACLECGAITQHVWPP